MFNTFYYIIDIMPGRDSCRGHYGMNSPLSLNQTNFIRRLSLLGFAERIKTERLVVFQPLCAFGITA